MGTPAAEWRVKGEPDPFGDRYDCPREKLPGGIQYTNEELPVLLHPYTGIMMLTIAKDRIRWLSRQLEKVKPEGNTFDEQRAALPLGEVTDDGLANYYYLEPTKEAAEAAKARIHWLSSTIKWCENNSID